MIFPRVLLAGLSLAALVSGLLDGGDFVSGDGGGRTVATNHEDIRSHNGLCPALNLHSLVSELFTCSLDLQDKPLIGNKELNRETVTLIKDDIEVIPQTQRANHEETKEDSEAESLAPAVIIPPLVVKATPKEMKSSTTVSPAKTTV